MTRIQYRKGSLFESDAQVLVNTVNCKGVMGKGLALTFKQQYPDMFAVYKQECRTGKLHIGRPTLYQGSTPWILNFPTKDDWRFPSKLEYLEKGLAYLLANYEKAGIKSIAFPKLGAQNGKLSWDEVGPLMAKYLNQLNIEVQIYIAEGDQEYYGDTRNDSPCTTWQRFNELALSLDRLRKEVGLSSRGAKQVYEARKLGEFTSQPDIDAIPKLAKTSSDLIKKYICRQQHTEQRLPDMSVDDETKRQRKASSTSKKRGKHPKETDASTQTLFPSQPELVG